MESIKKLISSKDDLIKDIVERRKYVSREYQDFGLRIASKLDDTKRSSLYIKLAKEKPRALIMQAFSFAVDYPNAKNRGKLFMWKLKDLENVRKEAGVVEAVEKKHDPIAGGTKKSRKRKNSRIERSKEVEKSVNHQGSLSLKQSTKVKKNQNPDLDRVKKVKGKKKRGSSIKNDDILDSEQIRFT